MPTRDGTPVETDPRKIWKRFADHFYLFAGTPSGAWLNHELYHVFGIRQKLTSETAIIVYEQIARYLRDPAFLPRALFDRFNIEVLTTTDAATDTLEHHATIRDSEWGGNVIPCFRPDAILRIATAGWVQEIALLGERCGWEVSDYASYIRAIEDRRAFFKSMGAVSTDHAVLEPYTHPLTDQEADALFQKAMKGQATEADQRAFEGHMLMEMARMSIEDGMVMQIHPGSNRNHHQGLFERFGTDKGADIPLQTEFNRNLQPLLNRYGTDPRLRIVLFTLDETTYSRELAPLAGLYPSLRLGPAWWFFDSIEGMMRYRQLTTETAGFYNTAGFNDDTRAFPSIPARHDLCRRVDANFLAGQVARHIIDKSDARQLIKALSYDLVKETYRLD